MTIIGDVPDRHRQPMDEVIIRGVQGHRQLEIVLDRKVADKRVFPAIDILKSGTRKEELITPRDHAVKTYVLRRILNLMGRRMRSSSCSTSSGRPRKTASSSTRLTPTDHAHGHHCRAGFRSRAAVASLCAGERPGRSIRSRNDDRVRSRAAAGVGPRGSKPIRRPDRRSCRAVLSRPRSFTGEDVCEFQVHGSPAVVRRLVQDTVACREDLRPAARGEFTQRAFPEWADRPDAGRSARHADRSDTERQREAALASLHDGLTRLVQDWARDLTGVLAEVEASIDFSDEGDVAEVLDAGTRNPCGNCPNGCLQLGRQAVASRRLRDGCPSSSPDLPMRGSRAC